MNISITTEIPEELYQMVRQQVEDCPLVDQDQLVIAALLLYIKALQRSGEQPNG